MRIYTWRFICPEWGQRSTLLSFSIILHFISLREGWKQVCSGGSILLLTFTGFFSQWTKSYHFTDTLANKSALHPPALAFQCITTQLLHEGRGSERSSLRVWDFYTTYFIDWLNFLICIISFHLFHVLSFCNTDIFLITFKMFYLIFTASSSVFHKRKDEDRALLGVRQLRFRTLENVIQLSLG